MLSKILFRGTSGEKIRKKIGATSGESEKSLINQISGGGGEILVERGHHREKCSHQFPIQPRSLLNSEMINDGTDWRVVVARNQAQLGSDQVFVR